jgi:plastocyanin
VSETYEFLPSTDDATLGCAIPGVGINAPRELAVAGDLPVVLRDSITSQKRFEVFGCDVRQGVFATPDKVVPDIEFHREVHSGGRVTMHDGKRIDFFGFFDPTTGEEDDAFPSPLMRVREGQVVHTTLYPNKNTHTIHHHGIEPTPHNDGVGHSSFEVPELASYTYQWRASHAGTYFYHCHKNTTLHFELGMYGPLIVDPPEGEGHVRVGTEVLTYDHEALWIPDDVDPRWHDLHHKAGLKCPWDDGQQLLRFEPTYFLLTGVPHPRSRTDRRTRVRCNVGDRVLLRLLNAAYGPIRLILPFDATVIGKDGHALGSAENSRYSRPYTIPAGQPVELTTAQRWDLLIVPDRTGDFVVPIDILHWIRDVPHGRVEGAITVS